jgi:hypothetical protein
VVDSVQLQQNSVTSNWQVNLLIVCNPYVPDPNMGGYFSPLAVETIFEPRSTIQTDGQAQLDNITVTMGQAVTQGDVIGSLYTAGEGAHVHFGTLPLGSMLAHGVPNMPNCPEPHFAPAAKTSILNLLHAVWPGAGMCYYSSTNPYTGLWWIQNESGWGMSLTQHGSIIFVAAYTYDQTGQPAWYVMSSCPLTGVSCSGEIYKVSGGTSPVVPWNGSGKVVSSVGSGTLTFADANTGTFAFTINGVTGSKSITRQVFATGTTQPTVDYTDLWWNPNESGWGVALTQQYGMIFAAWYGYDSSGNAIWYVASSCPVVGSGCTGDLYQVTGGSSLTSVWNGANKIVTQVGTTGFAFTDANNGIMNYTINGVAGSRIITRQSF